MQTKADLGDISFTIDEAKSTARKSAMQFDLITDAAIIYLFPNNRARIRLEDTDNFIASVSLESKRQWFLVPRALASAMNVQTTLTMLTCHADGRWKRVRYVIRLKLTIII